MPQSAELTFEIERSRSIGPLVRQTIATSAQTRSACRALQRTNFLLLAIVESLIAAHKTALAEGDGATIDVIQDALIHVGKRLVKETNCDGRSARTILGFFGPEPGSRSDRLGPVSG